MKKSWIIADSHFGHRGVTEFLRSDGTPLRPWNSVEEMDEALVANWNGVVGEFDRVYLLGDVAINKRAMATLEKLHGKKVLISGNHDIFGAKEYLKYFEDVRAYKVVEGKEGPRAILSHIPIHPDSVGRFQKNIHGHLHANRVMREKAFNAGEPNGWLTLEDGSHAPYRPLEPDPRYICVSVEQINYTPVLLENVIKDAMETLLRQDVP